MNNKRGIMGIVIFFVVLFLIMIIGFIAVITIGAVDFASDEITPVFAELGVVGNTNFTEASGNSVGVVNTIVQGLPWVIAFGYVAALIFSIVFALSYEANPSPMYIGVYLLLIILLIFGSIVMSNMYQDIYTGTDELATRLQQQTLMSYMILYAPYIFGLIAFITGIYLFSGRQTEGGV